MRLAVLCLSVLFSACGKDSSRNDNDKSASVAPIAAGTSVAPGGSVAPSGSAAPSARGGNEPKINSFLRPPLPTGWFDFKQPDGAFSVYLPVRTTEKDHVNDLKQAVPTGRALLARYKCQGPDFFCEFGVMIYSPELVDGVRAAKLPTNPNAKKTTVTWAGHPAEETVTENPENRTLNVERHMWIGNRSYHFNIWGMQPGHPTAAERAAIYDSFMPGN